MILIAIAGGLVLGAAVALVTVASVVSRAAKRRRAKEAFGVLSALRSPTGRPFFPETSEEERRQQRLLTGWDPTYGGGNEADPDRW